MRKVIQSIGLIINLRALTTVVFSTILTYVCIDFQFTTDLSFNLIAIAIVFPIVFSIGEAYKRRESALAMYGNLKAHGRALFFVSRDWIEGSDEKVQEELCLLLRDLLLTCREFFKSKRGETDHLEIKIYQIFSALSFFIKFLRTKGLASGEASRANQYISKMMEAFENMKHIFQYRTPRTLRAYSKLFVNLVPILYAPYFAFLAKGSMSPLSFINPVLYTLVLVGLDNIQDQLENPFDQEGEDDVKINAEEFAEYLKLGVIKSKP